MGKLEQIGLEILNTSLLEWIAVLSSVFYIVLIARKNSLAWFFALVGSIIYVYLCFISQFYLETILQLFYVSMAIIGWLLWNKKQEIPFKIIQWKGKQHLVNILISSILTLILGNFFQVYTDQALPYLDAFTTVFSISATLMVACKVLENWLYWIVIDIASMPLYAYRDLNLTVVLFGIYTIVAIVGFVRWRRTFKLQAQ
jgi:nicotinamide mononucleotide transporter